MHLLKGLLEELEDGNLRTEVEEVAEEVAEVAVRQAQQAQQVQKKGRTGCDPRLKQEVLLERWRPGTQNKTVTGDGSAADRCGGDGCGDVGWTHGAGLLQSSLKLLQLLLGLLVLAALALQLLLHLVEQGHHVVLLLVLGLALPLFLLKALLQVLMVCTQ